MAKILDKLIINSPLCKNEFNYDYFVYKYYEKCFEEKKMVKCPFCPDYQIKYKALEEYNNKLIEEKCKLLKEIQVYKDKLAERENIYKIKIKKNKWLIKMNEKSETSKFSIKWWR